MLSHALTFSPEQDHPEQNSPEQDESFFQQIPAAAAVFLLRGDGEPYISKTANLRRRLTRLLGRPAEQSKRLNLRQRVREIEFTCTGSDFESNFLLYQLLRKHFPDTYAKRLRLRPAPLVKLHLENEYPRASVTTKLGKLTDEASSSFAQPDGRGRPSPHEPCNLYYGPFPSRAAAEKFANDALDFFKMRRCVEDLHPDPAFPGCVYSEMKMCLAPCFKGCTDAEYHTEVGRVQNFFDTSGESLMREFGEQRERASAELAYEEAAAIHAKIEKLKPLLAQLPEIVRRIDRLDAIIIQPGSEPGGVCLFRVQNAQLAGPVPFVIEQRTETTIPNNAPTMAAKPRTMESRVEEAIQSFREPANAHSAEHAEHLAILKRWYYRSQRNGEIFFKDEKAGWPLRRMVRGIGRVYKGERDQLQPSFSATEAAPPPS